MCIRDSQYPGCDVKCADLLTTAFKNYVDPDDVAAVIAEPVLGEGGFVVPPPEYSQESRKHVRSTASTSFLMKSRPDLAVPARCSPSRIGTWHQTLYPQPSPWRLDIPSP